MTLLLGGCWGIKAAGSPWEGATATGAFAPRGAGGPAALGEVEGEIMMAATSLHVLTLVVLG